MSKEILGSIYYKTSEDFMRGIYPMARTVKAEQRDLAVVEMEERRLGNIYGFDTDISMRKSTAYDCCHAWQKSQKPVRPYCRESNRTEVRYERSRYLQCADEHAER